MLSNPMHQPTDTNATTDREMSETGYSLTDEQEAAVHGWLALLQETDPAFVAHVFHLIENDDRAQGFITALCLDGMAEHPSN